MAEFVNLAASAASGGVFGLIGTIGGRIARFFEQKQTLAHERARWEHEAVLLDLQMKAHAAETEAEIALADIHGSWRGLEGSMRAEANIARSYRWVDAVRGLTRPILTLLLWLISLLIFMTSLPEQQGVVIETATFAATAATLWWFGDRSPAYKLEKRER